MAALDVQEVPAPVSAPASSHATSGRPAATPTVVVPEPSAPGAGSKRRGSPSPATVPKVPRRQVVDQSGEKEFVVPTVPRGARTERLLKYVDGLDGMVAQVTAERSAAIRKITASANRRIAELEKEVAALEKANRELDARVRSRRNRIVPPLCAGDLQRVPISSPVALFPRGDSTDLFPLWEGDRELLRLEEREALLSCDLL